MKAKLLEKDELPPRWATFLPLYLESGNAYQSAITAGFSDDYAKVIKSRFPEKVRKSLHDALEAKGVTADRIAESVDFLLSQDDYQAVDKGISHAAKMGVGGGYAAEKHINLNVEVQPSERLKALADKLNQ